MNPDAKVVQSTRDRSDNGDLRTLEALAGSTYYGPLDHSGTRYILIGTYLFAAGSLAPRPLGWGLKIIRDLASDPSTNRASLSTLARFFADIRSGEVSEPVEPDPDEGDEEAADPKIFEVPGTQEVTEESANTVDEQPTDPLPTTEADEQPMMDIPDRAQTPPETERPVIDDDTVDPVPDFIKRLGDNIAGATAHKPDDKEVWA